MIRLSVGRSKDRFLRMKPTDGSKQENFLHTRSITFFFLDGSHKRKREIITVERLLSSWWPLNRFLSFLWSVKRKNDRWLRSVSSFLFVHPHTVWAYNNIIREERSPNRRMNERLKRTRIVDRVRSDDGVDRWISPKAVS